ncbi:MAG: alpha/beta hydrolase [Methanocorpusculum sp.]|nr:alpha/beta hydrolase [Methanocorpusculum sp.]
MTEIPQKQVTIGKILAILWSDPGEKTLHLCAYVHGLCGCKEEAESFSGIVYPRGWQVLSPDLPGHGERKHDTDGFALW